jgi:hypothetical protein
MAVVGGSCASMLFIVLFSKNSESSITVSLLMLLICGIVLLINGVIGLLSQRNLPFVVCSVFSVAIFLLGFIITADYYIEFIVLAAIMLFELFNAFRPLLKKLPEE